MTTAPKKRGTEILYGLIAEARGYPDAIILGRGDPDFDTPASIIDAGQEAMTREEASPSAGLLPLRQAIAERVKRVNGIDVDPETEVIVTNGGQEALFLMVIATITAGDEVIIPEPNYNTYRDAIIFAGGVPVGIVTDPNEAFRVVPERVREAITPKTRALLLVSPNNPAASVISREDQLALLAIAQEHDLIIIADDIYDLLTYDGIEHVSPASLPGGKARTLTLNALSKTYAMTGWRAGWIIGPADLMAVVLRHKEAISGPASLATQYAMLAALTGPQADMEAMRETYIRRRRVVLDIVDAMGLPFGTPQGGQFVFIDISGTGRTSLDLAQEILTEQHVLAYPGGAFSEAMNGFIRVTFLQPEEKLREGLEKVKRVIDRVMA
ncbi:MAG: aminotransferase class I/II-fold pyridoxal phosphate-dependent enzyme [bacterium]|nr:aminotransferase class I/II-fold pyridoxal phosphate-dependent enzyme [bacterium]